MKILSAKKVFIKIAQITFIVAFTSCNDDKLTESTTTTPTPDSISVEKSPETMKAAALQVMKDKIQAENLSFTVGMTPVFGKEIRVITGERTISDAENARIKTELTNDEKKSQFEKQVGYIRIGGKQLSPKAPKLDLREYGLVTPVRDQGSAGSCWAFGSMAAYESDYDVINSKDIDASEQYVINCSGAGTAANGGLAFEVFRWMVGKPNNIDDEITTPYIAADASCSNVVPKTNYFAIAWDLVDPGNDPSVIPSVQQIKEAMCKYGVISASVYVTDLFQAYTGGVFNENSNASGTNHAISLVGWDDSKKAWILKNSWGTGWGESCDNATAGKGYMWISYNANNVGRRAAWVAARKVSKN